MELFLTIISGIIFLLFIGTVFFSFYEEWKNERSTFLKTILLSIATIIGFISIVTISLFGF
jgi:hypothetical protein